jgi:hypothetical protein
MKRNSALFQPGILKESAIASLPKYSRASSASLSFSWHTVKYDFPGF